MNFIRLIDKISSLFYYKNIVVLCFKKVFPFFCLMVCSFNFCQASRQFDFQPLGSLNKIIVSLSKGEKFGFGLVRGAFGEVLGKVDLDTQNPSSMSGNVILDVRSLRFGYHKVDGDAQQPNWLNSGIYPKIFFKLKGLREDYWKKNILYAKAFGTLSIKNNTASISFPVSVKYLHSKRKQFDGKSGDVLFLSGNLTLSRGNFGIQPGGMLDFIEDQIIVKVSLVGCSTSKRPLLPSRLFI